jgi:hypothetical protein
MDSLIALRAVAAEFGLGISLASIGHDWKLTVFDVQGALATATTCDLEHLCRSAIAWMREVYAAELAPRV